MPAWKTYPLEPPGAPTSLSHPHYPSVLPVLPAADVARRSVADAGRAVGAAANADFSRGAAPAGDPRHPRPAPAAARGDDRPCRRRRRARPPGARGIGHDPCHPRARPHTRPRPSPSPSASASAVPFIVRPRPLLLAGVSFPQSGENHGRIHHSNRRRRAAYRQRGRAGRRLPPRAVRGLRCVRRLLRHPGPAPGGAVFVF